MIIDIHMHVGLEAYPEYDNIMFGRKTYTADIILKRMDRFGIGKSVLLPLVNPENLDFFGVAGNRETLEACRKHPDRLIPFCNVDPRMMLNTPDADLSKMLKIYKDYGCTGIGEVCANIPINDERCKNLFYHAGEMNMPLIFHMTGKKGGVYGLIDKLHLPGLEEVLKEFPNTIFIGHAMAFWNEIDGDLKNKDRELYPKGEIKKEGRLFELMRKYPNLYADISAGSGYNALSRCPETGYKFLREFHKKIFFGTDDFREMENLPSEPPILSFMREARAGRKINVAAYENIMHKNYKRVFK